MVPLKAFSFLFLATLTECQILSRFTRNQCKRGEFLCQSRECISEVSVCDGTKHCSDGSDETSSLCSSIKCAANTFQCDYGACIETKLKCDGVQNCADNSDEDSFTCRRSSSPSLTPSSCRRNEFKCQEGTCIDESGVCDGNRSCPDGSDEIFELCGTLRCTALNFQCGYGACIEISKRCDGKVDCIDGSDETASTCNAPANSVPQGPSSSKVPTGSPEPNSDTCLLPEPPENGSYEIVDCDANRGNPKCRKIPGTPVEQSTIIKYACNFGYFHSGDKTSRCFHGQWINEDINQTVQCVRKCKGIDFSGVKASCVYNGRPIDCYHPVPEGTVANMACREHYTPVKDDRILPVAECFDGEWTEKNFRCYADCGKNYAKSEAALVTGGKDTSVVEYPWHVALYRLSKSGTYDYICGGTIISPFVVLSAAHCFYVSGTGVTEPNLIKVVAGKTHYEFGYIEQGRVEFDVNEIIVSPRYIGRPGLYRYDMAILDLAAEIHFTTHVLPICLETLPGSQISPGTFGTVVGWGATENDTHSEILKVAQMPYINFLTCKEDTKENFQPYLTDDKFCTSYIDGIGVQSGDSGGSFMVKKNGLFYAAGIVSVKPLDENSVVLFTNIKHYLRIIHGVKGCLNRRHRRGIAPQQQKCDIPFEN